MVNGNRETWASNPALYHKVRRRKFFYDIAVGYDYDASGAYGDYWNQE